VLKEVSFTIKEKTVTAIMGPSGCGKTTLIRAINRMNELTIESRTSGEVIIDGVNIYAEGSIVYDLRRKVGMAFQKPNPFPKSMFENVAFGQEYTRQPGATRLRKLWRKA
jgi:phosphate transport system ATP-binding protein